MRVFELWCKVTEAESENENRQQEMNMTDLHDDTPSKPPSGDRYKMLITQMKTKSRVWKQGKKAFHTHQPSSVSARKQRWVGQHSPTVTWNTHCRLCKCWITSCCRGRHNLKGLGLISSFFLKVCKGQCENRCSSWTCEHKLVTRGKVFKVFIL